MSDDPFKRPDDLPSWEDVLAAIKRYRRYIVLGVIAVVGVVIVLSSWFTVEPEERAIVLRFGAPVEQLYGPGLHFKIPFVDEVHKVPVEQQRRLEFGFRSQPGAETRSVPRDDESLMLTGDLNLVHVRWSIIYKITDPEIWLFDVMAPQDETIRDIAESVMRQLVGNYSLHEVLTVRVRELQNKAQVETNRSIKVDVPIGVTLTELAIKETDVPEKAQAAFRLFNQTEPAVRRVLSEAKAEQTNITGQAQLEKERAIGVARRAFHETVKNAQGEAEAFLEQLEEYVVAPEITQQWMYLAAMTAVMDGVQDKVILDGDGQASNTLNVLPLTELMGGDRAGAKSDGATGAGRQR